jgi:hypothetical protein
VFWATPSTANCQPCVRRGSGLCYGNSRFNRANYCYRLLGIAGQRILLVPHYIYPELAGQSFRISGLENLTGNELAAKFTAGLGEPISYYAMPPREFGDILATFIPEDAARGVEGFYQNMVDNRPFPTLFSAEMPAILAKLPVTMTPIGEWIKQHKAAFLG